MKPEHFIYWLEGYLDATDPECPKKDMGDLKENLKKALGYLETPTITISGGKMQSTTDLSEIITSDASITSDLFSKEDLKHPVMKFNSRGSPETK